MAKKILKILLIIALIFALMIAGAAAFITMGKSKALNLDIKNVNLQQISDGTYKGAYKGYRWSDSVEVTVKNHQITEIKITDGQVFARPETMNEIIHQIKTNQAVKVDAVTGATADSNALMKAVENALENAK